MNKFVNIKYWLDLWKRPKPRGVIIYLARSQEEDVTNLIKSLRLLKEHFLNKFSYPVIIFVENSFKDTWKKQIKDSAALDPRFEIVRFEIPPFINPEDVPPRVGEYGHGIGYRHMCRFFSGLVYLNPILSDYDWYWRLDTDSFILSDISYDIFRFMKARHIIYGYINYRKEDQSVAVGLWDSVSQYVLDRKIAPTFLKKFLKDGKWDQSIFYTNFEISDLNFWRSKQYQDFFNYIDQAKGIYMHRWGDAPIHTFAISIFIPERRTHRFGDIHYQHQGFINSPFKNYFRKRCTHTAVNKCSRYAA